MRDGCHESTLREGTLVTFVTVAFLTVGFLGSALFAVEPGQLQEHATKEATGQASRSSTTTTLSVLGTIENYNPSTHVLSVMTPTGTLSCQLASTTRVRQGWHMLDEQALQKLVGHRAAVRYADADASKAVDSVHVFGR